MEPIYRVIFFKRLVGHNGCEVNGCQGMVEVHASSEDRAIAAARPVFANLARVADWTMRADSATAELLPDRRHVTRASGLWLRGHPGR